MLLSNINWERVSVGSAMTFYVDDSTDVRFAYILTASVSSCMSLIEYF